MGKRQEGALLTRKKILDAMRELLNEKSADSINIEDVTTRAGVAKGSFYTYFKRKEDLISVIAMESYDVIKETVLKSTDSPLEKVTNYLIESVKIIDEKTLEIAQNWMKSVSAPVDSEKCGISKYNYDWKAISEILENGISAGKLDRDTPVEHITQTIMNCYYGAVAVWCITKGKTDLMENMNNFCANSLVTILTKYEKK